MLYTQLFGFLVVVGTTLVIHGFQARQELRELKSSERRAVQMLRELLVSQLSLVDSDVRYLANSYAVRNHLADPARFPRHRVAEEFARFAETRRIYHQIRYIDASGQEQVRVELEEEGPRLLTPDELQNKADRYYFEEGSEMSAGEVYVSRFDLNVENDELEWPPRPMIRFATPVFDAEGNRRGIVILNYLGSRLLETLGKGSIGLRGRPMLLNVDGYWLHGGPAAKNWGFMYPEADNTRFGHLHPAVWETMSSSSRGQVVGRAGLFSFSRIVPLHHG